MRRQNTYACAWGSSRSLGSTTFRGYADPSATDIASMISQSQQAQGLALDASGRTAVSDWQVAQPTDPDDGSGDDNTLLILGGAAAVVTLAVGYFLLKK